MQKLLVTLSILVLSGGFITHAATIQENTVFPDINVIASQLVGDAAIGVRDIDNPPHVYDANMGQTFSLDSETTLRAITVKAHNGVTWGSTNDVLELWIGENTTAPGSLTVGATKLLTTINLSNETVVALNYYTLNLASDLVLPAGDYAFQFNWQTTHNSHQWFMKRASGDGTYDGGGMTFVQTSDGSAAPFPADGSVNAAGDLVFGLHSSTVGTVPSLTVDPAAIDMNLIPPNNQVTGAVAVAYTADTTMDITISISDESHPGSFSVLSTNPQTLTTNATLEFEFDNTVSNLAIGATSTGLVTIAWNETGSTVTNETVLPISVILGYGPDADNVFTPTVGTAGTWGDPANWDLGRVPGTFGADRGIIQGTSGLTCNVETNFTAPFAWRAWIRTTSGTANTLNIDADFKGLADISVGQAADHYGMLNQTAGAVEAASLLVGDPGGTAPSNSYYNLTGGTLLTDGNATLHSTGVLNIDGGSFSIDQGPENRNVNGDGLLKLQSGSFSTLGTAADDVLNVTALLEFSGGAVVLNGQNKFKGDVTVIGDGASIFINNINTPAGTIATTPRFVFEMGSAGISAITNKSWMTISAYGIVVDGANYTGGTSTFTLFDCVNLTATSTVVSVTNFAEGVSAVVNQDMDADIITVTITVPGYEGWIGGYGLSGTNADWDVDYDLDGEVNFYEYGLGGDPTNILIKGYVPTGAVVDDSGTDYFEFVYARRIGTETELDYIPEFGTDLIITDWSSSGVEEIDTGTIDVDYESVTNRVNMTGIPEGFMHLIIDTL